MNKLENRINYIAFFALGLIVSPILIWFELLTMVFVTMLIGMGILSLYLFFVSIIGND